MTMCLNHERIPGGFRLSRIDYSQAESIQMLLAQVQELAKETKEFESQYLGIMKYYEDMVKISQ